MSERPIVTVGGLIVAPDGEILLVQSAKWQNLYSVPGGKVESGETREEAFIREVWEEVHLKITNLCFAMVQDCIFSQEFWQNKHFVMHDFIADLDSMSSKEQVQLNHEAQGFMWIAPQQALQLPLQRECRRLIEWYLAPRSHFLKSSLGILGVRQHRVACIIGVYPEERQREQMLFIDAKVQIDLARCLASDHIEDTVSYVTIAQICTKLAQQKSYFLLESLASDIIEELLSRFQGFWAWVCIQKPSAILSADYAFVEIERHRQNFS